MKALTRKGALAPWKTPMRSCPSLRAFQEPPFIYNLFVLLWYHNIAFKVGNKKKGSKTSKTIKRNYEPFKRIKITELV